MMAVNLYWCNKCIQIVVVVDYRRFALNLSGVYGCSILKKLLSCLNDLKPSFELFTRGYIYFSPLLSPNYIISLPSAEAPPKLA